MVSSLLGVAPASIWRCASARTRPTSRPNRASQAWLTCPDRALPASSVRAARSGTTGRSCSPGAVDLPVAPHRYNSNPSAASGALRVTVTVLLAPLSWCSTRWLTSAGPASASTEATGPRLAHSRDTACGPRSHSAPLSCRHGVLNGLDSCRAVPSQTADPPAQPPRSAACASQARTSAWNRAVKNTTDATWACSTAWTRTSASAAEVAMGFSSNRCLPARAAVVAMAACTSGWHRERDPVEAVQERGHVVVCRDPVRGRQVCRGFLVAAPDRGELDAVGRRERGRVRDARPVAGAGQAELERPPSCHGNILNHLGPGAPLTVNRGVPGGRPPGLAPAGPSEAAEWQRAAVAPRPRRAGPSTGGFRGVAPRASTAGLSEAAEWQRAAVAAAPGTVNRGVPGGRPRASTAGLSEAAEWQRAAVAASAQARQDRQPWGFRGVAPPG